MAEIHGSEHLIIQTAFLGDLLLGVPLFRELKNLRPNDKIVLLCRKGLGSYALALGLVDEAIEVDKSDRSSWKQAVAKLRARHFDLVICPHQSLRSLSLVARLKAKRKIGYRGSQLAGLLNWIFSDRVLRPMQLPEALRQLALLTPLDQSWRARLEQYAGEQRLHGGQESSTQLLAVPEWASMKVPSLLKKSGGLSEPVKKIYRDLQVDQKPLVLLAPGSVWPTKRWTLEGYVEVAKRFLQRGYSVGVLGAPDERELALEIAAKAPGALSIAGETNLMQSSEVLALASLVICNDSGAMHMAALADIPTLAIFGPTILEFGYRPWQNNARVVQIDQEQIQCRPCGSHGSRKCPIGTHECMTRISSDLVFDAALNLIGKI